MGQRTLSVVCAVLAAVGLAWADSPSDGESGPAAERCAAEIFMMHGVWRSDQVFLPAYADLELVKYLASLPAREPGVAIIPVYAAEPIYFRSQQVVFLSTGFILQAGSEQILNAAIRGARIRSRTPDLPACAALPPSDPASLPELVGRLALKVAEYERMTSRRLRLRDSPAK